MDWVKTKTIFILLLLALNLFLAGSLLYGSQSGTIASNYDAYADKILEDRGIGVPVKWPDGPAQAGMLRFESLPDVDIILNWLMPEADIVLNGQAEGFRQYKSGSRILTITLATDSGSTMLRYEDVSAGYKLDVSVPKRREREIQSLLKSLGLSRYGLVPDRVKEADGEITLSYIQPYDAGYIFDNQVTLVLKHDGLAEMTISLHPELQEIAPSGGGVGDILTAQQALILSPLRGPLQIREIKFGWGQENLGELYFSPVWRIATENEQVYWLNAYTGVQRYR